MNVELCKLYGIDYQSGLARCLNNVELYEQILGMFLEDEAFSQLKEAYKSHNYKKMFESAHEIKGVSGNASLTDLYRTSCEFVEYLRKGGNDEKETEKYFSELERIYHHTKLGLTLALGK